MTIATGGLKARWPSIRRSCSLFDQAFPETAPGLLRRLIDHLIVVHHRGGGRRLRLDRLLGDRSRFRLNRFGIRRFRFKLRRRSRRDLGYRLRCRFGRRGFTCRQRFGLGGGPKVPLASMGHLGDQLLPYLGGRRYETPTENLVRVGLPRCTTPSCRIHDRRQDRRAIRWVRLL